MFPFVRGPNRVESSRAPAESNRGIFGARKSGLVEGRSAEGEKARGIRIIVEVKGSDEERERVEAMMKRR